MADIKLFRISPNKVQELQGRSATVEKSLQSQIEGHMEEFLGIRFLASEYTTGRTHSGRIDTLGIDENGSPVVVEYKRTLNENVITQGLFYLDWLMDHKAEFVLLVVKQLGQKVADEIDWASPRLLCIAGDFNKYDEYAVQQINRNIELIRYRRYEEDLMVLELVNATRAESTTEAITSSASNSGNRRSGVAKTPLEYLSQASPKLRDLYEALKSFLMALGEDVQVAPLACYIAFKRIRNFACVEIHPQSQKLLLFVKVDPDTVEIVPGFLRDVRSIGHFGTGDLEITISTEEQLEKAKPFVVKSYECS
jgi:predicted transport protein